MRKHTVDNILKSIASTLLPLFLLFQGIGVQSAMAEAAQHLSMLHISQNEKLPVHKFITIGLSKSMIVELPRDVRDVLISNPKVLDAVVHTSRRVYLIGNEMGQANAFFFDKDGKQVLTLEVTIEKDLSPLSQLFSRFIPGSDIQAEMINNNIILTGHVRHPVDSSRAADIAGRFVDEKEKVLNMLAVDSKEQVLLKVLVAEMNRNAAKRLGIDLRQGLINTGKFTFQTILENSFPISSGLVAKSVVNQANGALMGGGAGAIFGSTIKSKNATLTSVLEALERTGLSKTLAEPHLTAVSGETASFLAGGEFPIPVAVDEGTIAVEYRPFGVGLSFTPVVLAEGRISIKISTEVSELTTEGAVTVQSITLPALSVRRTETTVELPSGGSLVIAGLISEQTRQSLEGVPGLKDLPVLGTLFRSRDFSKRETELIVLITPYIVNHVSSSQVTRPDFGFAPPSDKKASFFGQLNRVYGGRRQAPPAGRYEGDYGFIVE